MRGHLGGRTLLALCEESVLSLGENITKKWGIFDAFEGPGNKSALVEEKFTKFSGEPRDARRISWYITPFWTNFEQNCFQNAKLGSAKISNFGSEIKIRFLNLKSKF